MSITSSKNDFDLAEPEVIKNTINDIDVINSHAYFKKLTETEILNDVVNGEKKVTDIIRDYRQEFECDNYVDDDNNIIHDNLPSICYNVFNWFSQRRITRDFTYVPELLLCGQIRNENQLQEFVLKQMINARIMNSALFKFPALTKDIIVYRGITDSFNKTINEQIKRDQSQYTCSSFISTSLFIDVAKRFANASKKIMAIQIPRGFTFAYISPTLKHRGDDGTGIVLETEVLMPVDATFVKVGEEILDGFTIGKYKLISYAPQRRPNPNQTINLINELNKDKGLFDMIYESNAAKDIPTESPSKSPPKPIKKRTKKRINIGTKKKPKKNTSTPMPNN